MRLRRALLAAGTAWLVVVLVGATAVWAVISRAGQELVAGDTLPVSGSSATGADPGSDPVVVVEPPGSIRHRPGRHHPSGEASEGQGEASDGPDDPGDPGDPGSPSSGGTGGGPPPSSPAPTVKSATWSQEPGSVTISCQGTTVLPNYAVRYDDDWGPDGAPEYSSQLLKVHFTERAGEGEYELLASCVNGAPHFGGHGDYGDDDDDDDDEEHGDD